VDVLDVDGIGSKGRRLRIVLYCIIMHIVLLFYIWNYIIKM